MPEAFNLIKKETLAQVFSCELCEISKNTFFHRTPLVAASLMTLFANEMMLILNSLFTDHAKSNLFFC